MHIFKTICCVCLTLLCIHIPLEAKAQDVLLWPSKADIACVATVVAKKAILERPDQQTMADKLFYPLTSYQPILITLKVHTVYKGQITGQFINLKIEAEKDVYASKRSFVDFETNHSYLIFAVKKSVSEYYSLVEPSLENASVVPVVEVHDNQNEKESVQLYTLAEVINLLSVDDPQTQMRGLVILRGYIWLMWDSPNNINPSARDALAEITDKTEIKQQLAVSAIPLVLNLTKSVDSGVRIEALIAAACLQVTSCISDLVSIADSNSRYAKDASYALSTYGTVKAIPALASYSKSRNITVRRNALEGIINVSSRICLPYLVDALSDLDPKINFRATVELAQITGEIPAIPLNPEQITEKDYVYFWKSWATKHQDELKMLRQQTSIS